MKKSYNLTEDAADQAARDAAEVAEGWKEFIEKAINDHRVLDYDKGKGSALTVTGQRSRLESITVASLTNNIAQFEKFVKDFKEKIKFTTTSLRRRRRGRPDFFDFYAYFAILC